MSFDQSIICKRHMTEQHSGFGWRCELCRVVVSRTQAHRNCDGTLKLVNRSTMTCTSEEKEAYDNFQRKRDSKIKLIKMTYQQKINSQKDNRRKSHQKENGYKRASPKRKSTLSTLYKPLSLRYGEADNRTGYEPNKKYMDTKNNSGKQVKENTTSTPSDSRTSQGEKRLVPSPLEKRTHIVNTLAEDLVASSSSDESEKAEELSIRVDDGQYSDISSVAGDDINQISPAVEESTVSIESRQVEVREEMEVTVASTSSTHIATSAGDSNRKYPTGYEASSIRAGKLKAIKSSQDRRFILNIGGIKFETCADTMASDPNSLLFDLIQTESPVKPYSVEGRSCYFIDRDPKHFPIILNYLRNKAIIHSDILSRDVRHLRELQAECNFYGLKHLSLNCERRILDLQFGHFI